MKSRYYGVEVPTSIKNHDDEQHTFCAALRLRPFFAAKYAAVQHHERHVETPVPLAQAVLNPKQLSSEEGRQSSDFMCSLRHIFTELADDQFLTALACGIAALRDADDPRARA